MKALVDIGGMRAESLQQRDVFAPCQRPRRDAITANGAPASVV
ncbi:MAG TPA: hypothetical protein VFV97_07685 [Rhodanobacteraceae bacterium]|nr:hypothetical protein [Rhodanobacteraceae bacterium]